MPKKKIELGGGNKPTPGYFQMDIKHLPGIDFVGDVRKLPVKDNYLDEIYGHWILEHFGYDEIDSLLIEWHRALRPGGLLHMVTNNGQAHILSYMSGEIDIHELNKMLFAHADKIEDLHKIIWTEELVYYFFAPMFSEVKVEATWAHREKNGDLKCPGLIIKAIK